MRKTHRLLIERNWNRLVLLIAVPFLILPILFSTLVPGRPRGIGDVRTPPPPRLAYLISGSAGDWPRVRRLLTAVYHPWNYYLVRLDLESQRKELMEFVRSDKAISYYGNVRVVENCGPVSGKGSTEIASVLQAVAILLREFKDWNWFINLSASDYPLMPQDDILHVFSYLPRDFNFIEHTSNIGWREYQRARPMIVDPGLHVNKTDLYYMKERRSMPSSFKLFAGSSRVILSRSFLEFCIWGWDNLPRMLLLYFANFLSASESYFHTVACNSKYFQNTTVNSDLHFTVWDNPPNQNPINLTVHHFDRMAESGSIFARSVSRDDYRVLDRIDSELLGRKYYRFTPGGWCLGSNLFGGDVCSVYGDSFVVRPSVRVRKLERLLTKLLESDNFRSKQCR